MRSRRIGPGESSPGGPKPAQGGHAGPPEPSSPPPSLPADFLRRIAHDVRGPIGLIAHALEAIDEELGAGLTEELQKRTLGASRAANRLARLAQRLEVLAEIESGGLPTDLWSADLAVIAQRGIELCQSVERRREVELRVELVEPPCPVLADPERLALATSELVHNAVRNARRRVLVRLERVGPSAVFSVDDDGRGIKTDLRERLLSGRSGTGLGLHLASNVVRAHGGRLTIEESSIGGFDAGTRGGRFLVTLPLEARP